MNDNTIRKEYTCFVYVEQEDGSKELTYVPADEWFRRLREDAGRKGSDRRYYKTDGFLEDGVLHVLVEEVGYEEYKRWNSAHTVYYNDFVKAKRAYQFVSLNDSLPGSDGGSCYEDVIVDPSSDTEEQGGINLAVDAFRHELSSQPEWMVDMMELYRYGYEKDCDEMIRQKYGVTDRTVRNYKASYQRAAKNFAQKWANSGNKSL